MIIRYFRRESNLLSFVGGIMFLGCGRMWASAPTIPMIFLAAQGL